MIGCAIQLKLKMHVSFQAMSPVQWLIFWVSFGALEKQNKIIAKNSSFLKIWKEFARIFVLIGSTTADPLFSAKMCRPCSIKQWPNASISFINYCMWRLKTSLITETNKIKSSTYTCESFRSSTYKGACAMTLWETEIINKVSQQVSRGEKRAKSWL